MASKRKGKARASRPKPNAARNVSSAVARPAPAVAAVQPATGEHHYDVALSFAGENRGFVEQVANILVGNGVRVFYDMREQVYLWGKDLGDTLDAIYRRLSDHVVIFVSAHYASKMWTNHERRSAFARAMQTEKDYILPARFDDTDLPGLRPTTGYIDLNVETPESFAQKVMLKIEMSRGVEAQVGSGELPQVPTSAQPNLNDVAGYIILGFTVEDGAHIWRMFGSEAPSSEDATVIKENYESVYFNNFAEMNDVMTTLSRIVTESNRGKTSDAARQAAFEHALLEEGISRASQHIFGSHSEPAAPVDVPGLKYVIWGVQSGWAPVFKLMRPAELVGSTPVMPRDGIEVYFDDVSVVPKVPPIVQDAAQKSNGNNTEFMRLLFEAAMRRQVFGTAAPTL